MMRHLDKYSIGIVLGLLLPALFGVAYLNTFHLWGTMRALSWSGLITSKLLMLACFPDLAALFLFYTTDTWRLAKGIVIGMFPYLLAAIWFTA